MGTVAQGGGRLPDDVYSTPYTCLSKDFPSLQTTIHLNSLKISSSTPWTRSCSQDCHPKIRRVVSAKCCKPQSIASIGRCQLNRAAPLSTDSTSSRSHSTVATLIPPSLQHASHIISISSAPRALSAIDSSESEILLSPLSILPGGSQSQRLFRPTCTCLSPRLLIVW